MTETVDDLSKDPVWDHMSEQSAEALREVMSSPEFTERAKDIAEAILEERGETPGERRVSRVEPASRSAPKGRSRQWAVYLALGGLLCIAGLRMLRHLDDGRGTSEAMAEHQKQMSVIDEALAYDQAAKAAAEVAADPALVLTEEGTRRAEERDPGEALSRFLEAERLLTETDRTDTPLFATVLNNAGMMYRASKDLDKAAEYLERATRIAENPERYSHLRNLSIVRVDLRQPGEALAAMEKALALGRKQLDKADPELATLLSETADLLSQAGEFERAVPLLEQALEINRAALGGEHEEVFGNTLDLAEAYFESKAYDKAVPRYEEVVAELEKLPDVPPADITLVKERIGECRRALGK